MKTKRIICRGQTRTIEDAIDAWKEPHDAAMLVRDLEDLIGYCLGVRTSYVEWYKEIVRLVEKKQAKECTGQFFTQCLDQVNVAMDGVADLIAKEEKGGYCVDQSKAFREAVEELKKMRQDFANLRLCMDPERVRVARIEIAQGRCRSVE